MNNRSSEVAAGDNSRVMRLLYFPDLLARWGLVVLLAGMLLAALLQVFSREFRWGLTGAEEVARYCMVAAVFLAIPVLTRSRGQISVDALSFFLRSDRARLWLARIILLIEAGFLVVFTNYSYVYVMQLVSSGQSSVALGLPLWIPSLTMPIGSLLGVFVTVMVFIATFRPGAEKDPYGVATDEVREVNL